MATNRWVTHEQDPELENRCWILKRDLSVRGYPGALFQVQDVIAEGVSHRMVTIIIPDGSTVNGEPSGRSFMVGEPALETPDDRHTLAMAVANVMDELAKGTGSVEVPTDGK